MKMTHSLAFVTTILAVSSLAHASRDIDIVPRLAGGALVTDGISDDGNGDVVINRVFTYDLGGDVLSDPTFTGDPGFHSKTPAEDVTHSLLPEGNLPAGSDLSFQILGPLQYWDGAGSVSFGSASGAGQLKWFLQTFTETPNVFVTGASLAQPGLDLGTVDAGNFIHVHIGARLYDDAGLLTPPPADGVYRAQIELDLRDPSTNTQYASAPVFVEYGLNMTDDQMDAVDAFSTAQVPEPATLGLLSLAMLPLGKRKRRQRAQHR